MSRKAKKKERQKEKIKEEVYQRRDHALREQLESGPRVLNQLVGSLESALEEEADEIDALLESDEQEIEVTPAVHNRRTGFIVTAAITMVFAVIGIIASIRFTSQLISDIANQTALKQEFARFIYPVVIIDPPEFNSVEHLPPSIVISAGIWRILVDGDIDKYEIDLGNLIIPAIDVESSARALFGQGFAFEHQSILDIEMTFTYLPERNSYSVPANPKYVTYSPVIDSIVQNGDQYTIVVAYMAPSPLAIDGIQHENEPIKHMRYHMTKDREATTIHAVEYIQEKAGVNDMS